MIKNNDLKESLIALAALSDYVVSKEVLEDEEVKEINSRLDKIIAKVNASTPKFFKRLL